MRLLAPDSAALLELINLAPLQFGFGSSCTVLFVMVHARPPST